MTGDAGNFSRGQLEQLVGVFRAEAVEHIRALAEILFSLEEGAGDDVEGLLNRAFREAHSLKGSAATLGFERVATVTHRMEDVLGELRRARVVPGKQVVDRLLDALDLVRKASENSLPGESELTSEEAAAIERMSGMVSGIRSTSSVPAPATSERRSSMPPGDAEPEAPVGVRLSQAPPATGSRSSVPPPPDGEQGGGSAIAGETFIRVAEGKLDTMSAQVGELFEANIQMQSTGHELASLVSAAADVSEGIGALLAAAEGTTIEEPMMQLTDAARSLQIRLRAASRRYQQDEYAMNKLIVASRESLREARVAPISALHVMIRQQLREMSRLTGKGVELHLEGGEYAVDRKVLDAISDPLVHLLRNAVDHAIEAPDERQARGKEPNGRLSVVARHVGDAVELSVTDDGRGVDVDRVRRGISEQGLLSVEAADELSREQLHDYLFEPGFSTREGVSVLSGRGVGLDVVKFTVERLGGEVRLESEQGKGSRFTMRLPLTMSTMRCLLVRVAGRVMAIPTANVERVLVPREGEWHELGGGELVEHDGQKLPCAPISRLLELKSGADDGGERSGITVIASFGERRIAFGVDELLEYAQVILKPLGDLLERVPNVSGISLLGTGELALVLNVPDLFRTAGGVTRADAGFELQVPEGQERSQPSILVVDDSIATRTLEKALLESAGYKVHTASDGYKALDVLSGRPIDLVISDVQMPNMDGFELTRTIKSRRNLAHVPVVLITSLGSDEDKAKGMAAGADGYIVKKKLTRSELVDTITQLL